MDPAWFEEVLLDREEPKDLADVWGLCGQGGLALKDALVGTSSKAVGVFAADVARALIGATADDWRLVRWIAPAPPPEKFLRELRARGQEASPRPGPARTRAAK